MAQLIDITDPADARLADYVRLRESTLRRTLENREGLFIAEGEKVIRRAIEAGYRPRSFLLAERWLAGLSGLLDAVDAPVYVVSVPLAEQITGFHVHRGALASLHREVRHRLDDLTSASRLVVLEGIVDHANLGAIIRCAAGLGWDGVVLSRECADPLYRRAIKTSMGTVFSLPWVRLDDDAEGLLQLRDADFSTVAMALRDDAISLGDYTPEPDSKVALLLGSEGPGLSEAWLAAADVVVRVPMARGVDSLNVAAAAAIACYTLRPDGPSAPFGVTGQSSV